MLKNKRINKFVNDALAIEAQSAVEANTVAYMARTMVMATLPHSKPQGFVFQRRNGCYTLTMKADPQFGLPYGSLPRLLLAWITREAKRTKSPILLLGKTFSEFLHKLRLSQSGGKRGDATRLREQMLRLITTSISYIYKDDKKGICKGDNFLVTRSFELWWDPLKSKENDLSTHSTITLAKDFFDELIERPIPVDFRVLQALRRSPLQIDIYIWLTYRFSFLKRSTLISWPLLKNQFGSDYAANAMGLRDFKKHFLKSLHIVTIIYQEAKVEVQSGGLILNPSLTHIKTSKMRGAN
ncbi:MAG: replication protein RepA [Gammaproteobacteria bacterium]